MHLNPHEAERPSNFGVQSPTFLCRGQVVAAAYSELRDSAIQLRTLTEMFREASSSQTTPVRGERCEPSNMRASDIANLSIPLGEIVANKFDSFSA